MRDIVEIPTAQQRIQFIGDLIVDRKYLLLRKDVANNSSEPIYKMAICSVIQIDENTSDVKLKLHANKQWTGDQFDTETWLHFRRPVIITAYFESSDSWGMYTLPNMVPNYYVRFPRTRRGRKTRRGRTKRQTRKSY